MGVSSQSAEEEEDGSVLPPGVLESLLMVIDFRVDTVLSAADETAGASTCWVDITCDASIVLALNLKLFFFFFFAKNDAVSAIVRIYTLVDKLLSIDFVTTAVSMPIGTYSTYSRGLVTSMDSIYCPPSLVISKTPIFHFTLLFTILILYLDNVVPSVLELSDRYWQVTWTTTWMITRHRAWIYSGNLART